MLGSGLLKADGVKSCMLGSGLLKAGGVKSCMLGSGLLKAFFIYHMHFYSCNSYFCKNRI